MHILCPHCRNPIEVVRLTPREEIACPSCGSSFRLETGSTTGWERRPGQKLGRFEVLDAVGQGTFGTVNKARDPELDRTVAVKVPRAGNLAGPQEMDRFLREARSVAQLRHPSIVTVHEVGQSEGVPYLVSDFVQGITLADLMTARRPGFREAAELVAVVAEALQYAHERGVVHRDVKPPNVMIGEDGRPCVMDFGLAKRDAGEITMTIEGQVLGTPAYMSPEQARGDAHKVDGRSDVYSLGVLLYELLTGELPFRGNRTMLLHQVLHDDPRPPRRLNDKIPRDLETVCLKAMAKEPPRRYLSAADLAADLRRWLNGEPIQARPVGPLERAARWARRRPAAAAALALSMAAALATAAAVVGLVYSGWLAEAYRAEVEARAEAEKAQQQAEAATRGEEEQRRKAEENLARAEYGVYVNRLLVAGRALQEKDFHRARVVLEACRPDLRRWEWYCLYNEAQPEVLVLPEGGLPAFSPDGRRLATAGQGGVKVWGVASGQQLFAIKNAGALECQTFSPDGRCLATGGQGGVKVWDAASGDELLTLKGHVVGHLAFSPDGRRLAAAGEGGVKVWDAATGQELLTWNVPNLKIGREEEAGVAFGVAFSPDGQSLATGGVGFIKILDAATGRELPTPPGSVGILGGICFSPDGRRLAAGGTRPLYGKERKDNIENSFAIEVKVWDSLTGQLLLTLEKDTGIIGSMGFSPDGRRLATLAADPWRGGSQARVWDAVSGRELAAFKGTVNVGKMAFSPDGRCLAMGGRGAGVWGTTADQEPFAPLWNSGEGFNVCFSPDGRRLASAGVGTKVRDVATGRELLTLKGPSASLGVAFSPDGQRVAAGGIDAVGGPGRVDEGRITVWDTTTGQDVLNLVKQAGAVNAVAFSPDGRRLASGGDGREKSGEAKVWDAQTGQQLLALSEKGSVKGVAFSPDGGRLAGAGARVVVWDAATGRELLALTDKAGSFESVAFSPDGGGSPGRALGWSSGTPLPAGNCSRRLGTPEKLPASASARTDGASPPRTRVG